MMKDSEDGKTNHCPMCEDMGRKLAAAESKIKASHEQEPMWYGLTAAGQIHVGDDVRFMLPSGIVDAVAQEVLRGGTDKEEVVYNRKKNHYFITSMVLDGSSQHKAVSFQRKAVIPPDLAALQRENAELIEKVTTQTNLKELFHGELLQTAEMRIAVGRELEAAREEIAQLKQREMVLVEILKRASTSLGAFCSDEGWAQSDMDTMDSVDWAISTTPAQTEAQILRWHVEWMQSLPVLGEMSENWLEWAHADTVKKMATGTKLVAIPKLTKENEG